MSQKFDFTPRPGFEMSSADSMGIFSDEQTLENNPHLQSAMERIENDPRFSEEALNKRMEERAKRQNETAADDDDDAGPSASSVGKSSETVPDVISFGFSKIVFEFISALNTRFGYRKKADGSSRPSAIRKAYELYWEIVEHEPQMPYEKFRDVVFALGKGVAQRAIDAGDRKMAKKVKKATSSSEGDLRQLYGEVTLELFDRREKERERLPKEWREVPASANLKLFDLYEEPLLAEVIQVHLFKLAKLNAVWTPKLDLQTRDRICTYLQRLCRVTNLIDNFDPQMKQMINSVSLNSLNAVQGKNKGEIDINALLDELQERVLSDDKFLDKIGEVAMKQAK